MKLKPTKRYWKGLTAANKRGLCEELDYTPQHLSGVFNGRIKPSVELVEELIARTTLTKHDFRPDLFDKGE